MIRLTVVTPGGRPAHDVSVVLEREGRVLQERRLQDGGPALLFADTGRTTVRIGAAGCKEQEHVVALASVGQSGVHRLDVQVEWLP